MGFARVLTCIVRRNDPHWAVCAASGAGPVSGAEGSSTPNLGSGGGGALPSGGEGLSVAFIRDKSSPFWLPLLVYELISPIVFSDELLFAATTLQPRHYRPTRLTPRDPSFTNKHNSVKSRWRTRPSPSTPARRCQPSATVSSAPSPQDGAARAVTRAFALDGTRKNKQKADVLAPPPPSTGTWQAAPGVVAEGVYHALKVGYRLLDCAYCYGNEAEVGQGLARAIKEGIVKREDVFVVTKVWYVASSARACARSKPKPSQLATLCINV